jgi:cellobiose dehydrogenase (acceptor)
MMQTDTVVSHPSVKFYDFYAAYTDPIESDAQAYLGKSILCSQLFIASNG